MMLRYYVGIAHDGQYRTFKASETPTEQLHGDQYIAVIGSFKTARSANFMARYGKGNPHCQTVDDAERLAKPSRLFEIERCGDPYNKTGWQICEFKDSFDEPTAIYRGDLSPIQGRERTIRTLRRMYPGCKIRVQR